MRSDRSHVLWQYCRGRNCKQTVWPGKTSLHEPAGKTAPRQGTEIHIEDEGELPDPLNLPTGCAFAARCPNAQDVCYSTNPEPSFEKANLHVACHFPSTSDNTTEGRASRPLQVAEAMKQFVVSGLQAGDKLPSEAELMALFGMAKGTIREATRILEAQGLVKTRTGPGGGCFVHEVSETRTRALLSNYFYFRRLTIRDIYQLRKQLEPELVAELAGKLDESAIAELHAITEEYETHHKTEKRTVCTMKPPCGFIQSATFKNQLLGFIIGFMAEVLSEVTTNRRLFEPRNTELWAKGGNSNSLQRR